MRAFIERFRDTMFRGAIGNFNASGYLVPVAFVLGKNRQVGIVPAMKLEDDADKDAWAELIRRTAAQMEAEAVLMITESWILEMPKGSKIPGRIARHPDRKEILMATLEVRNGDVFMYRADIHRLPGRPAHAGEFSGGKAPQVEGRFSRFLPGRDTSFSGLWS